MVSAYYILKRSYGFNHGNRIGLYTNMFTSCQSSESLPFWTASLLTCFDSTLYSCILFSNPKKEVAKLFLEKFSTLLDNVHAKYTRDIPLIMSIIDNENSHPIQPFVYGSHKYFALYVYNIRDLQSIGRTKCNKFLSNYGDAAQMFVVK